MVTNFRNTLATHLFNYSSRKCYWKYTKISVSDLGNLMFDSSIDVLQVIIGILTDIEAKQPFKNGLT